MGILSTQGLQFQLVANDTILDLFEDEYISNKITEPQDWSFGGNHFKNIYNCSDFSSNLYTLCRYVKEKLLEHGSN